MNTLRQAAQQALEALEATMSSHGNRLWIDDARELAVDALRKALEQPEQEPVAWMYTRLKDGSSIKLIEKRAEMPEGGWGLYKEEPLYTTPPAAQRKWVGLTDEEIQELRLKSFDAIATNHEIYRAIEAKLRSKNNE
jgi:hypothetical protein